MAVQAATGTVLQLVLGTGTTLELRLDGPKIALALGISDPVALKHFLEPANRRTTSEARHFRDGNCLIESFNKVHVFSVEGRPEKISLAAREVSMLYAMLRNELDIDAEEVSAYVSQLRRKRMGAP